MYTQTTHTHTHTHTHMYVHMHSAHTHTPSNQSPPRPVLGYAKDRTGRIGSNQRPGPSHKELPNVLSSSQGEWTPVMIMRGLLVLKLIHTPFRVVLFWIETPCFCDYHGVRGHLPGWLALSWAGLSSAHSSHLPPPGPDHVFNTKVTKES